MAIGDWEEDERLLSNRKFKLTTPPCSLLRCAPASSGDWELGIGNRESGMGINILIGYSLRL